MRPDHEAFTDFWKLSRLDLFRLTSGGNRVVGLECIYCKLSENPTYGGANYRATETSESRPNGSPCPMLPHKICDCQLVLANPISKHFYLVGMIGNVT